MTDLDAELRDWIQGIAAGRYDLFEVKRNILDTLQFENVGELENIYKLIVCFINTLLKRHGTKRSREE